MVIWLMNTTGVFTTETKLTINYEVITRGEARSLVINKRAFTSAIGHKATAEVLNKLLAVESISTDRISADMKPGDKVLCFQIFPRPPEGVILTQEELLRDFKHKFVLLTIS